MNVVAVTDFMRQFLLQPATLDPAMFTVNGTLNDAGRFAVAVTVTNVPTCDSERIVACAWLPVIKFVSIGRFSNARAAGMSFAVPPTRFDLA